MEELCNNNKILQQYRWIFADKKGGRSDGPNDAMGDNFKKDPYESFIRESIQNSLDAKDLSKSGPVHVSIGRNTIKKEEFPSFFDLKEHINACLSTWTKGKGYRKYKSMQEYLSRNSKELDYFYVSDTNTTGMKYAKDDEESSFYAFTKSGGNSVKNSDSSGGCYGYGKSALINISKLHTVLISTYADSGYHFAGISSLSSHSINGVKKESQGYFTNQAEEEPTCDYDEIPECFRRKEHGTTFFIIGTEFEKAKDLKQFRNNIIKAVIKNFWLAIYMDELIVDLNLTNDIFDGTISIDKENLLTLANMMFSDDDNAQRGHKSPIPYIDAVIHASEDSKYRLFKITTKHLGKVKFYLKKDKGGNDCILNFRSQHMLIYHERRNTKFGFYGVFICDNKNGNALLKEAENASHSEWDKNLADKEIRQDVEQALNERNALITACIEEVFAVSEDDGLEPNGLDEYLSIPSINEEAYFQGRYPSDSSQSENMTSYTTEGDEDPQKNIIPSEPGGITIKNKHGNSVLDKDGENQLPADAPPAPPSSISSEKKAASEPKEKDNDKDEKNPFTPHPRIPYNDHFERMVPDEEGVPSSNFSRIQLKHRVYAKNHDRDIEHILIIHSNKTTSNAFLEIQTLGEEWDENIPIIYSNNGRFRNNRLENVHLVNGRNKIIIKFEDNLRHCIKIKTYGE